MSQYQAINEEALLAYGAGDTAAAIALWQQSLALEPRQSDILTYIAATLKGEGEVGAAAAYYEQALSLNPRQPEAHYNLGNIRQQLGELDSAARCYRNALAVQPKFSLAAYNLGNVCRDLGHLREATECYRHAIKCDPTHAPSHNNLGNALKHAGQLEQAIASYQGALQCQPDYPDALYNLGNALFESEDFAAAIEWFDRAGIRDAEARALYCLYKIERFDEFRQRLAAHQDNAQHHSPQVATLAAHHAINFGTENTYQFCPQPFALVYHESIAELAHPDQELRRQLLADINSSAIDERTQGRLHNGVQSAGNLFYRSEASFRTLADIVRLHLSRYARTFADQDCELIRHFPQMLEFESSWYIRMRQGGHLDSHIHESGWISGVLYLELPSREPGSEEGCFELSLTGDNYPIVAAASEWPRQVVQISEGDIVLFPANLFHRTIPFQADAERICIAFDLMPGAGPS